MTPAPVIAQPDLEAWVWANLKGHQGVTSFAYTSRDDGVKGWQWLWAIQVDVRGPQKKATADKAELVRQELMSLPDVYWSDGFITYAQIVEGPLWNPDINDGAPRYTIRIEYRVHPTRKSLTNIANTGKEKGNP
jgi:hypothetical protein